MEVYDVEVDSGSEYFDDDEGDNEDERPKDRKGRGRGKYKSYFKDSLPFSSNLHPIKVLDSEECWGVLSTAKVGQGKKVYYHCKLGGKNCRAAVYISYPNGSSEDDVAVLYRSKEAHSNHLDNAVGHVGIAPIVREVIRRLLVDGMKKPKLIAEALAASGDVGCSMLPSKKQLANHLFKIRKAQGRKGINSENGGEEVYIEDY
jgi:hypothetical protein